MEMTEVEMVDWHHQLYGHESEQALGVGDGQGSLACCSPWDTKSQFFASGGQNIGDSASAPVLPMNIQD